MNRVDDQIWANCEGSRMTDWQCHLVAAGLIDCSPLLLTSPTTFLSLPLPVPHVPPLPPRPLFTAVVASAKLARSVSFL